MSKNYYVRYYLQNAIGSFLQSLASKGYLCKETDKITRTYFDFAGRGHGFNWDDKPNFRSYEWEQIYLETTYHTDYTDHILVFLKFVKDERGWKSLWYDRRIVIHSYEEGLDIVYNMLGLKKIVDIHIKIHKFYHPQKDVQFQVEEVRFLGNMFSAYVEDEEEANALKETLGIIGGRRYAYRDEHLIEDIIYTKFKEFKAPWRLFFKYFWRIGKSRA